MLVEFMFTAKESFPKLCLWIKCASTKDINMDHYVEFIHVRNYVCICRIKVQMCVISDHVTAMKPKVHARHNITL